MRLRSVQKNMMPKHPKMSRGRAVTTLAVAALLAIVVGVLIWLAIGQVNQYRDMQARYMPIIEREARKNGIDPLMLKALVWRESKFDRTKIGTKGEVGLAQIMQGNAATDWAKEKRQSLPSKAALADPERNLEIAAWYLGRAYKYWRDNGYKYAMDMALCEYNAGRSRTRKWAPPNKSAPIVDRIQIPSTKNYVVTINFKREEYFQEQQQKAQAKKNPAQKAQKKKK